LGDTLTVTGGDDEFEHPFTTADTATINNSGQRFDLDDMATPRAL
jgi:hypothetical protein